MFEGRDVNNPHHFSKYPSQTVPCVRVMQDLQLSKASVYRAFKRGEIPAKRVGNKWIILRAPYEKWLNGDDNETDNGPLPATHRHQPVAVSSPGC